jgi:uncharacterized protein
MCAAFPGARIVQFNREATDAQTIRSCEPGRIRVGESWYTSHLIVTPRTIIEPWQVTGPAEITSELLAPALEQQPEILLIGTGMSYSMCDVRLIGELAGLGIGVEFMDTPAACRTFNVLVHEQRSVVAALYNG